MARQPIELFTRISTKSAHPLRMTWLVSCALSVALWQGLSYDIPLTIPGIVTAQLAENQSILSEADKAHYLAAFAAEAKGEHSQADAEMAALSNPRLVGYLLAARYLSADYHASAEELRQWFDRYSDHPQALRLEKLAAAAGIDTVAINSAPPLRGDGRGDHLGRTGMPDRWYQALGLWREGKYGDTLALFQATGDDTALSDWQRAAGYYWAYRAATNTHNKSAADDALKGAAAFPETFYGLLAVQQKTGAPPVVKAPQVSAHLRQQPAILRAQLLTQLGRSDDAEEELRYSYRNLSDADRAGLVTLAHEMDQPSLQARLASTLRLPEEEARFATYPAPGFVRNAQKEVSPALMLSIARNESGFREEALNHSGARGMMQMLPSTARAIERHVGYAALAVADRDPSSDTIAERLSDPATSVRYSAQYLKILSREPGVGQNLIRILAAYNAGPGTVKNWQSAAQGINDPLLYIESIPYAETRNYVMQVLAGTWVYTSVLGEPSPSLASLAQGQWPTL